MENEPAEDAPILIKNDPILVEDPILIKNDPILVEDAPILVIEDKEI